MNWTAALTTQPGLWRPTRRSLGSSQQTTQISTEHESSSRSTGDCSGSGFLSNEFYTRKRETLIHCMHASEGLTYPWWLKLWRRRWSYRKTSRTSWPGLIWWEATQFNKTSCNTIWTRLMWICARFVRARAGGPRGRRQTSVALQRRPVTARRERGHTSFLLPCWRDKWALECSKLMQRNRF